MCGYWKDMAHQLHDVLHYTIKSLIRIKVEIYRFLIKNIRPSRESKRENPTWSGDRAKAKDSRQ